MTDDRGFKRLRVRSAIALMACACSFPIAAQQLVLDPAIINPAPATLPALTTAQAATLAKLIAADSISQGLQESAAPVAMNLDGDSLVKAALDHARAVHAGRLIESDFQLEWGIRPQAYDPLPGFADAVARDRLAEWIASLPPPYAGYDTLVAGLARYRSIAAAGGWTTLANVDVKPASKGPSVAALRRRIALEDTALVATGDRYDASLVAAVRRAQQRYGLNPTGAAGSQTIAALNVPVEARIRQIMANMERWRWLPTDLPKNRIQMNIAAAVLTVFEGDTPVMSMKVVTGKPGAETPMLVSQIHSIVLNPPWNVPASIANRELWPKEKARPGYLKRNGFRVIEDGNGGKRLQQSSELSALGKYKFDFDNRFAVYLHDTPAQAGFARFDRLSSHGCVRLERPDDLAKLLLKTSAEWSPTQIDATIAGGKTIRASLADREAVYLLYWTAFASSNGMVSFRSDPYGWDKTLAAKIVTRQTRQVPASI